MDPDYLKSMNKYPVCGIFWKFTVGDRVVIVDCPFRKKYIGKKGIIIALLAEDEPQYLVKLDFQEKNGHLKESQLRLVSKNQNWQEEAL